MSIKKKSAKKLNQDYKRLAQIDVSGRDKHMSKKSIFHISHGFYLFIFIDI